MSFEERITRLRQQGVLTEDQADRLARVLSEKPPYKTESRRPAWPYLPWILIAAPFILLALYLMLGGGGEAPTVQDVSTSLNQAEEIGQMAKSLTGGISIALFVGIPLLALLIWFTTLYNGLVSKEEAVFESWAQVESNQQRRADLIPNILETVSRYMRFEHETLVDVISERSDAISGKEAFKEGDEDALRESIESLTEAQERSSAAMRDIKGAPQDDVQLEQLYQAQKALGASMHRILALAENYPVLRSAEQMQTLQAELEGSENRINVARMRFNEAAARFNASIRRMPASLVASLGDFKRKAYFEADEGAEKVIAVEFD